MRLSPSDPGYPFRLAALGDIRAALTVSGPLEEPERTVAIVGSRRAGPEEAAFAHALARALAGAGVTIVSGGARGIDTMAHRGAMDAGGTTWCVSPVGRGRPFKHGTAGLFAAIEAHRTSRMIWPLDGEEFTPESARARNRVLVALADAVVVVQAALSSGSRNAMRWALEMQKPLWVVPAAPWRPEHLGSLLYLRDGKARPLWDPAELFVSLGLPPPEPKGPRSAQAELPPLRKAQFSERVRKPRFRAVEKPLEHDESVVISALSDTPTHVDRILDQTGLGIATVRSALLTLTMKNVVVEGPDGFFRRHLEG